jgi:hypothetical protein
MPITKATAAAMSPLRSIERRVRDGKPENQSRAALMRPAKFSRRSGRVCSVSGGSVERPAFHRFLRARILPGALRALPVTLSK